MTKLDPSRFHIKVTHFYREKIEKIQKVLNSEKNKEGHDIFTIEQYEKTVTIPAATRAVIWHKQDEKWVPLSVGYTICSPKDNPSRQEGARRAIERAKIALNKQESFGRINFTPVLNKMIKDIVNKDTIDQVLLKLQHKDIPWFFRGVYIPDCKEYLYFEDVSLTDFLVDGAGTNPPKE